MTTIFNIIQNHKETKLPTIPTNIKLNFTETVNNIPKDDIFTFYQICRFPVNNYYGIRKIFYNQDGVMKTYKIGQITKEKLKLFLEAIKCYKYAIYPVYNFDNVQFPEPHIISILTSNILNNY